MRHTVVTTFHKEGYEKYGKKCLETFIEHWPKEVKIIAVTENTDVKVVAPNLTVIDQAEINPLLVPFKQRYRNDPRANGQDPKQKDRTAYLWDAVRFSNKVYAVTGAYRRLRNECDQMIWLDADTVTHSPVPLEFLDSIAPKGNELTAYLNRKIYPECGWVGYNLKHPLIERFMDRFENVYESGEFLRWIESHDSYVFWQVMKEMESLHVGWRALGDDKQIGHVFINSVLGSYMDHLKGPRKDKGKSRPGDLLVARTEGWWQGMNK